MGFGVDVENACDLAFVEGGYRRPRRGTILWELDDDFLGWIGLNTGNHSDYVDVYPFVGIHAKKLEILFCQFSGEKYKLGDHATISKSIIDISPEFEIQRFLKDSKSINKRAKKLFDLVNPVAQEYFINNSSYADVLEELEKLQHMGGGIPEKVSMIYHLSNEVDMAISHLRSKVKEFGLDGHNTISDSIENFLDNYLTEVAP